MTREYTPTDRQLLKQAARHRLVSNGASDLITPNGRGRPALVTAPDLMAMEFPDPRWAVPGIVPEGLSLLVGRPKQGKSWLIMGLALSIAYGGKALGSIDVQGGDVLLLCLEDPLRRVKNRMRHILAGEPTPSRLTFATEWPRLDEGGAEEIDHWLSQHPEARFVGIDVLQRMRPKQTGEGRLYEQDYQVMADLKQVADHRRVGLTAVHHTRKEAAEDPFDLISGTTGIGGGIDTGLVLIRERGQADANLYVRGRDVEEQDLALSFDGSNGRWQYLGAAEEYKLSQGRKEIVDALRAQGPLRPKEVALIVGKKIDSVGRTMQRMAKTGELNVDSDGRYTQSLMKVD